MRSPAKPPNLESYLRWRGDVPFAQDPFNACDNLVLSNLAYYDFSALTEAATPKGIPLREACARLGGDAWALGLTSSSPTFLEALCAGERLGGLTLRNYVDEVVDGPAGTQFCAMEFVLPDNSSYLAFRGTDTTLVGWREDFEISFKRVPAQTRALSYLQFALMMRDLGVHMIFASTPQAKGRVERYNSTAQLWLPTDIVRFGVSDYDELNRWFNEYYAPYLNSKFSYRPTDPRSDFMPLPDGLDPSAVSRTRETRRARGCSISYGGTIYMMADCDGVVLEVPDGTELDVHVDAITEEMYVERSGKRWSCVEVAKREGRAPSGFRTDATCNAISGKCSAREAVARGDIFALRRQRDGSNG